MTRNVLSLCSLLFVGLAAVLFAFHGRAFPPVGVPWYPAMAFAGLLLSVVSAILFGNGDRMWKRLIPVTGFLMLIGLMTIYIVNPSYSWETGYGAVPLDALPWLPASVHAEASLDALWMMMVLVSVGYLAVYWGNRQRIVVEIAAVLVGTVVSVVVIGQRLTPVDYPVFPVTGFFSYENQFASFTNLIIPVAVGLGLRFQCRARNRGSISSPCGLFYVATLFMVAAILLSGSRAGVAIMLLLLTAFPLWMYSRRGDETCGWPALNIKPAFFQRGAVVGMISLMAAGMCWAFLNRTNLLEQLLFRKKIMLDTLSVFIDYPVWGAGPGTFRYVFPYYQSLPVDQYFIEHAHCEPLQALAEYGAVGGITVLFCVFLLLKLQKKNLRISFCGDPMNHFNGMGRTLALAGVLMHSLLDFPFRHPLVALISVTWLGMLVQQRADSPLS